ncbi:SAFB-like transcription modulator [Drosophila obscura]|uniref:SAFB-like transcription modulator n=1 Tax=Drosophila obscura TaxID=7282 RepID=UPI001BB0E38E|nr:SAFB-like transcription modulator [Drosophila obscura]
MAFMARQNQRGEVVDRKQLSGRRTRDMRDLSDSEESTAGLTNRTLYPLVADADTDTDSSSCTLVGNREDVAEFLDTDTDTETETMASFCRELEEGELEDALAGLGLEEGNKWGCQEDWRSETGTLVPAASIGDCRDLSESTLIQGGASPTDSLKSYNSCRTYLLSSETPEDMEASEDRELMTSSSCTPDTARESLCSWSDAYAAVLEAPEGGSNFLPSLNLESCSPHVSTGFKSLEAQKKDRDSLQFEAWKQRKAEERKKKILAAKREREKRERATTERLEQSQRQVREWRLRKEQQERNNTSTLIQKKSCTSVPGPVPSSAVCRQKETAEERRERLKEWERRKVAQQQQERDRARRQREQKEQERKERLQRSEGAWSKWMANIDKRPKPVPLNQGFDSLRGSASQMFINPNEWDSSTDPPPDARDV